MNAFEKIVFALQFEIERPSCYGWFHLLWLALSLLLALLLILQKEQSHEKTLKSVLLVYGIGALVLEVAKQVIWSFEFDPVTQLGSWDYQWYAFPFQLCTTPIIASFFAAFLKKGKLRSCLLSYMAFVTILGSVATAVYPESCFVRTLLVDVHTMYLHLGSLIVSVYLLASGEVKVCFRNLLSGYVTFLMFVLLAEVMNVSLYQSGVLQGETFNMFYISPYFTSSLPVFDTIQGMVPFPLFLLLYLVAIFAGSLVVYLLAALIGRIAGKRKPAHAVTEKERVPELHI